ncbi:hypothetical protein [Micromonospora profundi]|uniref:hypothetical protein n=1 Tax=Micromonospora profundi TaxID=1420889 RepID=UPI003655E12C
MTFRSSLVLPMVAVVMLAAAGCSSGTAATPVPAAKQAAPTAPGAGSAAKPESEGPTAEQVVAAFDKAGLPVLNARDNSGNCAALGCTHLLTTDAISVYVFPDAASAQKYAETAAIGVHQAGTVVLNYAAARTPDKDQPRYEKVLAGLL